MIDQLPRDGAIFAVAIPVGLAYLKKIRQEIKERAGNKSELSGRSDRPLEAAHLDHTRGDDYQDPNNGILCTDIEHAAHHIIHQGNAEAIGLGEHQNEWAVGTILTRVFNFSRAKGIPDSQTTQEIHEAINLWNQADEDD